MNFFEALSSGFRNYVNFSGRAVRSEYWYFTLFTTIVLVVFGVIDETLNPGQQMGVFSIVTGIVSVALLLPALAILVRRLHDIDRTGWWALLGFTIIGAFVLIYWACQRGTLGQNRFGPDPIIGSRPVAPVASPGGVLGTSRPDAQIAPTHSKLPLWQTVGQAYAVWARNLPDLVRISWLWMLLMAPILAIWMWWQVPHVTELMQAARAGTTDPNPLLTVLTQIIGQVIMLPALASVAVAWHRLLLRDEHPRPGIYLRFDHIVVGYAILAFLIGVITLAPGYLSTMIQAITGSSAAAQDVGGLVVQSLAGLVSLIAFFVVARLSLALPGKALGRDDVTLGSAWKVSEHNTWRMFWAYFFCILPLAAISGGISYWLFSPGHNRAVVTLVSVVISLIGILILMISVGLLSLAYRHFFERSA